MKVVAVGQPRLRVGEDDRQKTESVGTSKSLNPDGIGGRFAKIRQWTHTYVER